MEVWLAGILGLVGGLARGGYGLVKAVGKGQQILPGYFAFTVVIAAVMGILMGVFLGQDYHVAALAGYVGTDFLENLIPATVPKAITLKR